MDKIVVIGGGDHAKVVVSVLKKSGYEIIGYTDRADRQDILGVKYLGDDSVLPEISRKYRGCKAIIGIGKIDTSKQRLSLQNEIRLLGFDFPAITSPHSIVNEEVLLGSGTAVLDGVVVNSGTETGSACILNTNCTVEHDCRIGDNVHIAPGVILSGAVTIGNNCLIGAGAIVIKYKNICEGCLIGAGTTVIEDINVPGTYVGNPAKRIK